MRIQWTRPIRQAMRHVCPSQRTLSQRTMLQARALAALVMGSPIIEVRCRAFRPCGVCMSIDVGCGIDIPGYES